MKNIKIHIIALICLLLFSSCEKFIFEKEIDNNPKSNLNYLQNELKNKYAFFDLKKINPIELEKRYTIDKNASDIELFNTMAEMLNELHDGHVNLISPFNVSRYDITLLGPENINTRLVKTQYLKDNYYSTGPFTHNFIKDSTIGYIRYSSFSSLISNYQLDFILNRYKNTKGLIIDMRQNGGGAVINVFNLLSRLTDKEVLLYKTQIKSGPKANDFTELEKVYSSPSDKIKFTKPVAILTDRGSYSATSFFSVCTYALDNVFLVGDTTGGGLGLPNGGQLPNGWTYRFSITRTIAIDGGNYENGVPPDFISILDSNATSIGVDNVIEDAVNHINLKSKQ